MSSIMSRIFDATVMIWYLTGMCIITVYSESLIYTPFPRNLILAGTLLGYVLMYAAVRVIIKIDEMLTEKDK